VGVVGTIWFKFVGPYARSSEHEGSFMSTFMAACATPIAEHGFSSTPKEVK